MKSSSILHSVRTSFFCLAGNIPEGLFWHQFSPQVIFPMWDFFFERCLKGILFCPIKHLQVQFFDIICRKYTFLPFMFSMYEICILKQKLRKYLSLDMYFLSAHHMLVLTSKFSKAKNLLNWMKDMKWMCWYFIKKSI